MENFKITRILKDEREIKEFPVSREIPLTIEINGKELSTLLCSPGDIENMVTGFLFTSGFINDPSAVKNIVIDPQQWKVSVTIESGGFSEEMAFKRIYTSGCGRGIIFHNPLDLMQQSKLDDGLTVKSGRLFELMRIFLATSEEHSLTHGVHSSALSDSDGLIIFRDDIGRHNSIDKVIGEALVQKIGFTDKMMLTSGRISSEVISKTMRCGCPILASPSAPTDQAVKLASSVNMTIAGLVRGKTMNIYTGEQRIT